MSSGATFGEHRPRASADNFSVEIVGNRATLDHQRA
jgi:hypothetical protein